MKILTDRMKIPKMNMTQARTFKEVPRLHTVIPRAHMEMPGMHMVMKAIMVMEVRDSISISRKPEDMRKLNRRR